MSGFPDLCDIRFKSDMSTLRLKNDIGLMSDSSDLTVLPDISDIPDLGSSFQVATYPPFGQLRIA